MIEIILPMRPYKGDSRGWVIDSKTQGGLCIFRTGVAEGSAS